MKTYLFCFFTLLITRPDQPNWVEQAGDIAPYNSEAYIMGFAIAKHDQNQAPEQALQTAKDYAKEALVSKILTTVQSSSFLEEIQEGTDYTSNFQIRVRSLSRAEVPGMESKTYYDKKQKRYYVLVYAKKDHVIEVYQARIHQINQQIAAFFVRAEEELKRGNGSLAYQDYARCVPLIAKRDEKKIILIGLGQKIHDSDSPDNITALSLSKSMAQIRKQKIYDFQTLASDISFVYQKQIPKDKQENLLLMPFVYENSAQSSDASVYLRSMLAGQLGKMNWKILSLEQAKRQSKRTPLYMCTGSYWSEGDSLTILSEVVDMSTQRTLGSYTRKLNKAIFIHTGKSIIPNGWLDKEQEQALFSRDELSASGLNLDVFLNKKQCQTWRVDLPQQIRFKEGETVKISIRLNHPAYVQLIYHLSDGSRVLLLDNYYFSDEKVNELFCLPYNFEVVAPFGYETLQVNAQSEKFPALAYKEVQGYKIIQEDLSAILFKTRGLSLSKKVLKAEKRINIVTMP